MTDPSAANYSIVGTAGHIDHGKSALVEALTGSHPDRLREERERGITIDLGFADTRIGERRVAFVDVPGHERFVRNMLAGVGGIDAVLLVVAADESVMPQTREHFAICRLLGVEHGVVAVTKSDLVDLDLAELVGLEVAELLEETPLADAPAIVTSVVDGQGLDSLREALAACLAEVPARPAHGLVRLPIDRVFSMKGFGTVVTGTLWSGRIAVGDRLEVLPHGTRVTVRGAQVHGAARDSVEAGHRTALNLHGVAVEELWRGAVLATPGGFEAASIVDVELQVLPGFEIEHLQRVRFHHGAVELLGRAAMLGPAEIAGPGRGLAQLRLEAPYPLAPGDRFILRRYSPVITIAGGIVLDPRAPKRRRHDPTDAVAALRGVEDRARLDSWVVAAGARGLPAPQLRRRLALDEERFRALVDDAVAAARVIEVREGEGRLFDAAAMTRLGAAILERLERYHRELPLRPAMPKSELASEIGEQVPASALDAALQGCLGDGAIEAVADGFALSGHRVRFDDDASHLREQILERFEAAGMAAPPPAEILGSLADPGAAHEVLRQLLREGRLVRVRDDLVVDADAMTALVDDLRHRVAAGESFAVADFKGWTGLTRKHSIPVLEYLDRIRVTRRIGDLRIRVGTDGPESRAAPSAGE